MQKEKKTCCDNVPLYVRPTNVHNNVAATPTMHCACDAYEDSLLLDIDANQNRGAKPELNLYIFLERELDRNISSHLRSELGPN